MIVDLQNNPVFWDYKNINLESELWQKTYLERIIVFWSWTENDLSMIKKYYKVLNLPDYWKNYFNFYFSKYDIN
jgi:hypothetical protein